MACVRRRRGRWVVDFRDADGNRRWESYKTRDEADTALGTRIKALGAGTYKPPAQIPTFAEVAAGWLDSKRDRRVSTGAQYEAHLDLHLLPTLGPKRLNEIHTRTIEALRDERRASGLAPQTVNKLLTTASAVFQYARRHELCERNPAEVAERCRRDTEEVEMAKAGGQGEGDEQHDREAVDPATVLSPEQTGKLIAHAEPGFYQAFFLTAVLTGARVGELTGLTWPDIDLEGKTIAIRRSVSWAKARGTKGRAKPRFLPPKTKTSRRTIPIPDALVSALKRWKLACPPCELDLVFPNREGTPRHRSTIAHDGLKPALLRAKLSQEVTVHSLRHSFASALIMRGEPVTRIASLLGHSSPAITLAVYSHWFRDAQPSGALEGLASVVCGASTAAVAER